MNIDADALLARIRREYPMQYQLCQMNLTIDLQAAEIERLQAELAEVRGGQDHNGDDAVPIGDPPLYGQPMQSFHLQAAPPYPQDDDR